MPRDWDARTYDRVADPMTRWGTAVLDRLPLEGDERVLDAGCGTGRVTERLAERLPDGHVIALDGSPAMVDAARERLARFGDRVEYVVADLGRPLPIDGYGRRGRCRPRRSTGCPTTTRCSGTSPRSRGRAAGSSPSAAASAISRRSCACWPRSATAGSGRSISRRRWRHDTTARRGRLRGHRVLADRGADAVRGRRAVRGVPADGRPRARISSACPPTEHDAFVARSPTGSAKPVIDYVRLNITPRDGADEPGRLGQPSVAIAIVSMVRVAAGRIGVERTGHLDPTPHRLRQTGLAGVGRARRRRRPGSRRRWRPAAAALGRIGLQHERAQAGAVIDGEQEPLTRTSWPSLAAAAR